MQQDGRGKLIKEGFCTEGEHGILPENPDIPYYAIKLTKEQAELVKGKTPKMYQADGHHIFDIRDGGKFTGEKMLYIIWV